MPENLPVKFRKKPKPPRPPLHDKNRRIMPRNPNADKPVLQILGRVSREELAEMAQIVDADRFRLLIGRCLDAGTKRWSLAAVCRSVNVSLADLHDIFRNVKTHEAMLNLYERMPDLMNDVMADARSRKEVCPECSETPGLTAEGEQCPRCQGTKQVQVPGDEVSRKLAFEAAGFTNKARGPLIELNQNFTSTDPMENTMIAAQKFLDVKVEP